MDSKSMTEWFDGISVILTPPLTEFGLMSKTVRRWSKSGHHPCGSPKKGELIAGEVS